MKARDKLHAPGRYATTKLAIGLATGGKMSIDSAYRVMSASKTLGSKLKTRAFFRKTDADVDDLSPTEQRRMGRVVARADGGVDLDDDIAQAAAKQDIDAQTAGQLQRLYDTGFLNDETLRYVLNSDIDQNSVQKLNKLDGFDFPDEQVQSKFKHADEFGVAGTWNKQNGKEFREALVKHILDSDTKLVNGKYKRLPKGDKDVQHLYNPKNGNNVMMKEGEFLSGWKLSKTQKSDLETTGTLGGGG